MRKWIVPVAAALLLILGACPKEQDTVSPTVEITAPADGDTLPADTVTITAHATDNKGVTAVRFYLDATEIALDSTPESGNYSAVWDAVAETLGGTFKFKVRASDSAENFAEDSITVHIRRTGGGPKYHGGTLAADEVWYATGNPHICTSAVVVDGGRKLTIEPGCEVRFRTGAGIIVGQGSGGELIAVGKPDTLIQFTSDSSAPNPGIWTGIAFHAATVPTTRLSYCRIDYGGSSNNGALVANPGAQFSVDHCNIARSAGAGLFCEGEGHPTSFTDNVLTGNLNYPVRIKAAYVGYVGSGNVLTGNAQDMDAIFVVGSGVDTSATWRNLGVPYLVNGDVSIGDASGPVVTIEPGTTVKLALNTAITIGYNLLPGALKADATGGQQILFTSTAATRNRGDWLYIYFDLGTIDGESKLKNCKFQFGGRNMDGEIYLYNANPEISGCAVDSSAGFGIYLDGTPGELPDPAVLRANNTFTGNALGDVYGP
jgi:hypothetical protein